MYMCSRFAMAYDSIKLSFEVSTCKYAFEVPKCMFGMMVYSEVL